MSCTFDSTCRPAPVIGENGEIRVLTRIGWAGIYIAIRSCSGARENHKPRQRKWIESKAKPIHW
jgi:hypothetical protein